MVHRAYWVETYGAGMRDNQNYDEPNPARRMMSCCEQMTGRNQWDGQVIQEQLERRMLNAVCLSGP